MTRLVRTLLAAALVLLVACGEKAATPATQSVAPVAATTVSLVTNARFGQILTDGRGFALYFFDGDADGRLGCVDACISTWPPLLLDPRASAPTGSEGLGVVARQQGRVQVALGGRPLYLYSGDRAPGDVNGDGVGGAWHVARPGAASTAPPSTASETSPAATTTQPAPATSTPSETTPAPQATSAEATQPPEETAPPDTTQPAETTQPPATSEPPATTQPPETTQPSTTSGPPISQPPCPYPPCY